MEAFSNSERVLQFTVTAYVKKDIGVLSSGK
jgi:hypothetical protein